MNEQITTLRSSIKKNIVFSLAGVLALMAGVVIWFQLAAPPALQADRETVSATVLPQFKLLQPFSLKDQHGRPFGNNELLGQWTFLSFGYTHCPDICPTTLSMLKNMDNKIRSSQPSVPHQITFVSIDPERDTQSRMAEYIKYFDPSFLGVTGNNGELNRLTRPLGILYAKVVTEKSAMDYVMDHSAAIILVDPQGRYHALFSAPHDPDIMAKDFDTIVSNY